MKHKRVLEGFVLESAEAPENWTTPESKKTTTSCTKRFMKKPSCKENEIFLERKQ